jgi:hypothetical protein
MRGRLAQRLAAVGLATAVLAAGCGGRASLEPDDLSLDAHSDDATASVGQADASLDLADVSSAQDAVSTDAGTSVPAINAGCGKPLPAAQPQTVPGKPTGYMHYTVMGTGATLDGTIPEKAGPRTFWVRVPADYNPNRKYRTVYLGQGCGGYNVANTATFPLYNEKLGGTEQAIYVALDIPTDMANQDCYDNRDGPRSQEWEAFELIHSVVDGNYCVDNDNVFVSGYSTGGWLTNMWGCYFAGDGEHPWNGQAGGPGSATPRRFAPRYHLRGQAAVSGGEPDNNPPCNGPIAAIWIHDTNDSNPYTANHTLALNRVLKMNGCFATNPPTKPWHDERWPGVCVQYTDCPAAYPVVFCTTSGLSKGNQSEKAVPAFKLLFDEASGVVRGADAGTD